MAETRDEETGEAEGTAAAVPVRYPAAIAVGGGLAAAVGSSFIPMNAIEGFVSAYGIAELLPAAAPPLGNTARLALSTGIGTLTAGALLALLPRGETDIMGFETAVKSDPAQSGSSEDAAASASRSGTSRLAGWLRTLRFGKSEAAEDEVSDFADLKRLRIRNADQHPDAPVRAPIMASSDLDAEVASEPDLASPAAASAQSAESNPEPMPLDLDASMAFAPPASAEPAPAEPAPAPSFRFAPALAEPEVEEDGQDPWEAVAPEPVQPEDQQAEIHAEHVHQHAAEPATADYEKLGIAELLDRLERGLGKRRDTAMASVVPAGRVIALTTAANPINGIEPVVASDADPRFGIRRGAGITEDAIEPLANEAFADATAAPSDWSATVAEPAAEAPGDIASEIDADHGDPETDAQEAAVDDDMDAALRDALATLRQLSDRQRNI
ncbi:MAG: hypothetical protein HEQ21_13000 [Blastomonas sp.]|uniref:hypothetical protein n=1 Tax=Blastomonas TaxID=150203 RepID=UPI00258A71AE|nr:hypothetical protein [Blastomonas sp.]MCO5793732.1 hypothetical protein [Blastomonas sp.]